jgi:hypothetical protein
MNLLGIHVAKGRVAVWTHQGGGGGESWTGWVTGWMRRPRKVDGVKYRESGGGGEGAT